MWIHFIMHGHGELTRKILSCQSLWRQFREPGPKTGVMPCNDSNFRIAVSLGLGHDRSMRFVLTRHEGQQACEVFGSMAYRSKQETCGRSLLEDVTSC
jgi:hypothetical protein